MVIFYAILSVTRRYISIFSEVIDELVEKRSSAVLEGDLPHEV